MPLSSARADCNLCQSALVKSVLIENLQMGWCSCNIMTIWTEKTRTGWDCSELVLQKFISWFFWKGLQRKYISGKIYNKDNSALKMLLEISRRDTGMLQSKYHQVTQFHFPPWQTDGYALLTIQCKILRRHKIHSFIKNPSKLFCSALRNSLFYIISIFS